MIIFDIIYHILELILLDDEVTKFKYNYNSQEEYDRFENPEYRRFQLALSCITISGHYDCGWIDKDRSVVTILNINRGNVNIIPKGMAEEYLKALMKYYRQKKKFDPKTPNDINMIEDYYFAI